MPDRFDDHEPFEPDDFHQPDEHNGSGAGTPPPSNPAGYRSPAPVCPKCQSSRIDTRNRARKAGSAIGATAGVTSGVAFALPGAETGAMIGVVAGPPGAVFGAIAGAVIAGLIGGAAGCATGAVFGEIVDEKVLDNFRCLDCGHTFSCPRASV